MRFQSEWIVWTAFLATGCKPVLDESALAYDKSSESVFVSEECQRAGSVPIMRVSIVKMGDGRSLTVVQPDVCGGQNSAKDSSGLSLAGPTAPTTRPVYVHYGYAGNAPGDQLVKDGGRDALTWARQNNFHVVDLSGARNISAAQQALIQDRQQNPTLYGPNGYVLMSIDSHGSHNPQTGATTISKTNVGTTQSGGMVQESTSYQVTDVQRTLLEGVGHNAGTVVCATWSCQSRGAIDTKAFADLQKSKINPDQKRVFLFSSSPDQLARTQTTIDSKNGPSHPSSVEQSFGFLTQQANAKSGLTVADFQNRLKKENLGGVDLQVQTLFVPQAGVTDVTASPKVSHQAIDFTFMPQRPSVITAADPKKVFILPPGIRPNTNIPPVQGGDSLAKDFNKLPVIGNYVPSPAKLPGPQPEPAKTRPPGSQIPAPTQGQRP